MRITDGTSWRAWEFRPKPVSRRDFETDLCELLTLEQKLESLPKSLRVHGEMLQARLSGATPGEIAVAFGVSRGCVIYRLKRVLDELGVSDFSDY